MKKIALALALALALTSCEDEIDFSGSEPDQMVVLNCLAMSDSTLTARVTLSRFFLDDNPYQPVVDAQLVLSVNGLEYSAVGDQQGNYTFAYTPHSGDTLSLTLICPQSDSPICGQTVVPQPPVVEGLTCSVDSFYRPLQFLDTCVTVFRFAFRLQQPLDEGYYRMRILCDIEGDTVSLKDQRAACFLPDDFLSQGSTWFFTHEAFNSLEDTIQFLVATDSLERRNFRLSMEALSPEFYRYTLACNAQQGVSMGSEPANVPTNLTGGALGLFGSAAQTVVPVQPAGKRRR